MATAADEPAQALKDRVAGELKEYERGREVYANRKFFEYEQATQNEKKIMGMVGQSERAATIPRPGEWVVQAPLKVKAGRKWNASQSLSSLRDSMDGSNAKSRRSRPRPFPTGGVQESVSFDGMDTEFTGDDFQTRSKSVAGVGDISRLQADNVLQRRSASATPAPVPLSMPGERDLTDLLLRPEEDQVFATTSLRDIVKSRRRAPSVDKPAVGSDAPVPTEAYSRLANDMTRMDALGQDIDTEASRVFEGSALDLGPPPADLTIHDPNAVKSPVRRMIKRVQESVPQGSAPNFFPLGKFENTDLEYVEVAEVMAAAREQLEEGQTLSSVLAEEGPGTKIVPRVRSRWYLSDGTWTWEPCFLLDWEEAKNEFVIEWHPGVGDKGGKGRTKVVSRLNLLFDGEDPDHMEKRREVAAANRLEEEQRLRYRTRLQQIPHQLEATERQMGIISKLIGDRVRRPDYLVDQLTQEVQDDYAYVVNKQCFDAKLPFTEEATELPEHNVAPKAAPERGTIQMPWHDFRGRLGNINAALPAANPLLLDSTQAILKEMEDLKDALVVSIPSGVLELADFTEMQIDVRTELVRDWNNNLFKRLEDAVLNSYSSEGMEDLEEQAQTEVKNNYNRFLVMTNVWYRDSLRFLATDSLDKYCEMFVRHMDDFEGDPLGPRVEFKTNLSLFTKGPTPSELLELKVTLSDAQKAYAPFAEADAKKAAQKKDSDEDSDEEEEDVDEEEMAAKQAAADALALAEKTLTDAEASLEAGVQFVPSLEDFTAEVCSGPSKIVETTCGAKYVSIPVFTSEERQLNPIAQDDPAVSQATEVLQTTMADLTAELDVIQEKFEPYLDLVTMEPAVHVEAFMATEPSTEDTHAELTRLYNLTHGVEAVFEDVERFRMFTVKCDVVKKTCAARARLATKLLLERMRDLMTKNNDDIRNRTAVIYETTTQVSEKCEETFELEAYSKQKEAELPALLEEIQASQAQMEALQDFEFELSGDELTEFWTTVRCPADITEYLETAEGQIADEKTKFLASLEADKVHLTDDMDKYGESITEFEECGIKSDVDDVADRITALQELLEEGQRRIDLINSREELYGTDPTDYSGNLELLIDALEPHGDLWLACSKFRGQMPLWMEGPFKNIEGEELEDQIGEWIKALNKMAKGNFAELETPMKVLTNLKQEMFEFKKNLPLINALRNPGLRLRHWKNLEAVLPLPTLVQQEGDGALTLQWLLEQGLAESKEKMEIINDESEKATKEYKLEVQLTDMKEEWQGKGKHAKKGEMVFATKDYKGQDILTGTDDMQAVLDDHLVKTQTMTGSPYIKPNKAQADTWEKMLVYIQDLLDEWLLVQRDWMSLSPVFSSEDIMRQMPTEGRRFQAVDAVFKQIMAYVVKTPVCLEVAADFSQPLDKQLLTKLKKASEFLELIKKGLSDYLEKKRAVFPRFYFLDDEGLLMILAQARDPTAVQPHLGKCFDNIARLTFERKGEPGSSEDCEISEMHSGEKECVALDKVIHPFGPANNGNVEMWLLALQETMKTALHKIMIDAMHDYATNLRKKFVISWPGATVLGVTGVYWTRMVESGLDRAGVQGLKDCVEELNKDLQDVVILVRGKLTKMQLFTLGAMTTLDVHARDVVDAMIEEGIEDKGQFTWTSQLRYYWYDTGPDRFTAPSEYSPENLVLKMIIAEYPYGWEYLGNSFRLVVTGLTDRCYRTLMMALHLNLGGAPAGPAGTGKTETTKDLSKAVAKQCVVFNCSDALTYFAMAKFFKGLSSSGAWACFDEFNRISLEVLSVVAQQVKQIQDSVNARMDRFFFEGTDLLLALDPACWNAITMNPGYAGRSELPDNLKVLYRDVAMMVPNYTMIAEISLYSFGFDAARPLSVKVTGSLRLSSEQLSAERHYDFGMRAVKSILNAAGRLKRLQPQDNEDVLVKKAIMDVNLPKFTAADTPLFIGILSDLFPGLVMPEPDYSHLKETMREQAEKLNIQIVPSFEEKVILLYEMFQVRHGLCVCGQANSGKSMAFKCLAGAMTRMNKKWGLPEEEKGGAEKVEFTCINPKSVKMGQLYGDFDPVSLEWTDGELAIIFRNYAEDPSPNRKWVIFDGPVDAIWIENMNTVLDDNKKLCLNSGEIIKMSESTTMCFEVGDLKEASPATVSRIGVIFMEPASLGWQCSVDSWLERLPVHYRKMEKESDFLRKLTEYLLPEALKIWKYDLSESTETQDIWLVHSCLKMFDAMAPNYRALNDEGEPVGEDYETAEEKTLESIMVFAVIWSIGATTDSDGRVIFNDKFTDWCKGGNQLPVWRSKKGEMGRKLMCPFNEKGSVYDNVFNRETNKWVAWESIMEPYTIAPDATFQEMTIPTLDSTRYGWILETMFLDHKPVLFAGETGTGKTVVVKTTIAGLDQSKFDSIEVNFSAQTTANQTQLSIDGKMEKRRKGVYGPLPGKWSIVFVDDLNMPAKETYGAQPPIEILRQFMDHGGWYDLEDLSQKRTLQDVQFVSAQGPPTGGRSAVTPRYLHHYNLIEIAPFQDVTLSQIFTSIMDWFAGKLSHGARGAAAPIVAATIEVYRTVARDLLPTPSKSHYTFNLRDLSKVIQGVLGVAPDLVDDSKKMVQLWIHEEHRVFKDRLTDVPDREYFDNLLSDMCKEHFKEDFKSLVSTPEAETLLFADFMIDGADKYDLITSTEELIAKVEKALADYNAATSSPMNLVLFMYAVEHVCRISRCLRNPGGHALLVGIGGSGRQSCTRLAAAVADMGVLQPELTKTYGMSEWHDDIKRALDKAGGAKGDPMVFLFTDQQIFDETQVEEINGLLNTCEVPNLWKMDEYNAILEAMSKFTKAESRAAKYLAFVNRCKANMHMCLCMSPIGESFRIRLRNFPALVNCTTINWFTAWPGQALEAVAGAAFATNIEDADRPKVVDTCVAIHQSVEERAIAFTKEYGRVIYVTPTSYLELIKNISQLLQEQSEKVDMQLTRYGSGLDKMAETEGVVGKLQAELAEQTPIVEKTSKETAELMAVVSKEQAAADIVKANVEKEAAAAKVESDKAAVIEADVQEDLAKAMPAMAAAEKALKSIKKADIDEMKKLNNAPSGCELVMCAVVIMFGVKFKKKKDEDRSKIQVNQKAKGGKIDDYWGTAREVMGDPDFLTDLLGFKDNFVDAGKYDDDTIAKMQWVLEWDSDGLVFTPDSCAKKGSKAAGALCTFVFAIKTYYEVVKEVEPKKKLLAEAQATVKKLGEELAIKDAELQEVIAKVDGLQKQLAEAVAKKKELDDLVDLSKARLVRADQLLDALGGNKVQWIQNVADLKASQVNLLGDVLLAAGSMSYLGPFRVEYRRAAQDLWKTTLGEVDIPTSEVFSVEKFLGDPVAIRQWGIYGLPNDSLSTENGIIVCSSSRWPLMIDPQTQGNKWIRNMEEENNLSIVKLTQKDCMRNMETAIQMGLPVLLENIENEIDASLDPILTKSYYKKGSTLLMKLGENEIEYDPNFKLYITTKLRSPHYSPETSAKVAMCDFTITQAGLEDQLVGVTAAAEQPEKLAMKEKLTIEGAENAGKLVDIENEVLKQLAEAEGFILDNETLINTLSEAKATGDTISAAMAAASKLEVEIDRVRNLYIPIANVVSVLYFCISDLANIDPMYQFSLAWFVALYQRTIAEAEAGNPEFVIEEGDPDDPDSRKTRAATDEEVITDRMAKLEEHFLYSLYCNACRCLFERDKLLFSLNLCMRLKENAGTMDATEWKFFLTCQGGAVYEDPPPNPAPEWLQPKSWADFLQLQNLEAFKANDAHAALADDIAENIVSWKIMYDSNEPHTETLPGWWGDQTDGKDNLSLFQKLLVLRCVRVDFVVPATQNYVVVEMGQKFVEPPGFSLEVSFQDSTCYKPMIFILTIGQDISASVDEFATKMGFDPLQGRLQSISLGQGQDIKAVEMIRVAKDEGTWVLLHNCHLLESWMGELEALVEKLKEDADSGACSEDFRLWLTSMPSEAFPTAILQTGVKMTNEPPNGIRANVLNKYRLMTDGGGKPADCNWYDVGDEYCNKPKTWRKLLFTCVFNHALMTERCKFGPLGWNINCPGPGGGGMSSNGDPELDISLRQLQIFLDLYDEVQWEALNYLIGHCNYGGKITDDWDRLAMMSMIGFFVNEDVLVDGYKFGSGSVLEKGEYYAPSDTNLEGYQEYLQNLPLFESPQLFGLHENANITYAINQSNRMVDTVIALQSGGGGGGGGGDDDAVDAMAEQMLGRLPDNFDMEKVEGKYPIIYEESLNTVLKNDTMGFNVLLDTVRSSLKTLRRALKGFVSMSAALDDVYNGIAGNKQPSGWAGKAYPSLKTLASWFNDLLARCAFLQKWYEEGPPNAFWLSGFFFTQAFLTAVVQNFARAECIPIDQLYLTHEMMPTAEDEMDGSGCTEKAEYGTYVHGLFMEGARWSEEKRSLIDSVPKVLFTQFPVIWLKPRARIEEGDHTMGMQLPMDPVPDGYYRSPMYKTAERRGILSTTGQSTNYVMAVYIPTVGVDANFWSMRAVCLLTCLTD